MQNIRSNYLSHSDYVVETTRTKIIRSVSEDFHRHSQRSFSFMKEKNNRIEKKLSFFPQKKNDILKRKIFFF